MDVCFPKAMLLSKSQDPACDTANTPNFSFVKITSKNQYHQAVDSFYCP